MFSRDWTYVSGSAHYHRGDATVFSLHPISNTRCQMAPLLMMFLPIDSCLKCGMLGFFLKLLLSPLELIMILEILWNYINIPFLIKCSIYYFICLYLYWKYFCFTQRVIINHHHVILMFRLSPVWPLGAPVMRVILTHPHHSQHFLDLCNNGMCQEFSIDRYFPHPNLPKVCIPCWVPTLPYTHTHTHTPPCTSYDTWHSATRSHPPTTEVHLNQPHLMAEDQLYRKIVEQKEEELWVEFF